MWKRKIHQTTEIREGRIFKVNVRPSKRGESWPISMIVRVKGKAAEIVHPCAGHYGRDEWDEVLEDGRVIHYRVCLVCGRRKEMREEVKDWWSDKATHNHKPYGVHLVSRKHKSNAVYVERIIHPLRWEEWEKRGFRPYELFEEVVE